MHFPRLVLKGFIIGAALCFPSIALADKADHVPASKGKQANTAISNVQGHGFENSQNKFKEHVKKEQKKVQQKTSQIHKNIPKKTKKIVNQFHSHAEKKIIHTKDVKKGIHKGLKKGHFKTDNIPSSSSVPKTLEQTEKKSAKVDVKTLPKKKTQLEKQVSVIKKSVAVPSNTKKTLAKKSQSKKIGDSSKFVSKHKKDLPSPDKSLPQVQIVTTTTIGGNNSTGSSNDRYNIGTNTLSLSGWFEWDNYKLPSFNRLFISRSYELCNQWTNAPPVQPPK